MPHFRPDAAEELGERRQQEHGRRRLYFERGSSWRRDDVLRRCRLRLRHRFRPHRLLGRVQELAGGQRRRASRRLRKSSAVR